MLPLALLAGSGVLLALMIVRFVQARSRGNTDGAWLSSPMVLGTTGGALGFIIAAVLSLQMVVLLEGGVGRASSLIFSLAGLVGGIAGIVSSAIVKRHRKAAGVLMLVGGIAALVTIFGSVLMIVGGVLALVPAKAAGRPCENGGQQ